MTNTVKLHKLTFEPFISDKEIDERVEQLGADLNLEYKGKKPIFIPVLNGSFVFAADLLRKFEDSCEISFVKLASYAGTESTGEVQTHIGLDDKIRGRHIIIVEDIIDTGNTMHAFLQDLQKLAPASVAVASLLVKPDALQHPIDVTYKGFDIPTDFVVGYGLDYDGLGRNLPHIYRLQE